MKIALASVPVTDPNAALKVYTEKLGFTVKQHVPEMQLAVVVSPEDPDGTALLLEPRGNLGSKAFYEGIYNAGMPVIVFGTDDIRRDVERLQQRGVVFRSGPAKTEWGTLALFEDGCGNLIQLHQAP
jgi:catechol 2,3-dioxygenase-like lactoylglutathione lyase family enzyme